MATFQSFILTSTAIIAVVDNKQYHVGVDHVNFSKMKEAYKNGDADEFVKLANIEETVKQKLEEACQNVGVNTSDNSGVKLVNGEVLYNGKPMNNTIVDSIKRMLSEGFSVDPMIKFLERLMKNPSYHSVEQLFKFLEVCGLTITEDGCFLAYKTVKDNYMDKYSGRYNNAPGEVNEVPRNSVDDNPRNTCSYGFHVGALAYAGPGGWYNSSGDKVVICKVDPADVVAVPEDHSFQKLRTCKYVVVGDFQGQLKSSVYSGEVGDNYSSNYCGCCGNDPQCGEVVNSPSDMLVDSMYEFTSDGCSDRRFGVVMENRNPAIVMDMVDPDDQSGDIRLFMYDGISDIREYDGDMTYEEWLNQREDDQELCDDCGEHCTECCCCEGDEEDEDEDDYRDYRDDDHPEIW